MRQAFAAFTPAFLLGVTLAACGGSGSMGQQPSPGSAMVPVSFSISDAPPMGVTILRFQIQLTAATLQPSMQGQQPVPMLTAPVDVELEHLQSEPALLANLSVPAATYNSLSATFANPQVTIFNETGQTLTVGAQNCSPNQVCTLTLPLNQMSVTVQAPTPPFPITLSSNSPLGLLLHFDVNASVQGDLSVSPTISLAQLPAPSGVFEKFHLVGTVTAVNSPDFTLQTGFGNLSFTVATNSDTQYKFDGSCVADNFSCISVGQVLKVFVMLMSDGTLVAQQVRLFEPPGQPSFQGVVISANPAQNQFQVVLTDLFDEPNPLNEFRVSIPLTVQPTPSATFSIDTDEITLPAVFSFASVQDIVLGQSVEFHPVLLPPPAAAGTLPSLIIGADSVRLESSEITGTVEAVNPQATPPNFILGGLPPLFTKAGITQIEVEPVTGTEFDNVSGLSGLNTGDSVSVGGLLFNTPSQPTVIAERILKRQAGD